MQAHISHLSLASITLPDSQEGYALDKILNTTKQRTYPNASVIQRSGSVFQSVYYIRSGIAKRVFIQADGREQILGFPLPGEFIGLEAIGERLHGSTVLALDMCLVAEIPYSELEVLMYSDPLVARLLYERFAASLRTDQNWMTALGLMNAEERVATFLLDLSQRYSSRGYSSRAFLLRMTRADIGHFLGLTLETVSRILSKFQKQGLVRIDCKQVEINNLQALHQLASPGLYAKAA